MMKEKDGDREKEDDVGDFFISPVTCYLWNAEIEMWKKREKKPNDWKKYKDHYKNHKKSN